MFKSLEKNNTCREIIIDKITRLLIPILLWNWVINFPHPSISYLYFLSAVFISSISVIVIHTITKHLKYKSYFQLFLFSGTIIFFYLHGPFNLFYLYPFFILGYISNIFRNKINLKFIPLFIFFIIGVCLWQPEYSPWQTNPATTNKSFTPIYLFQFFIGAIGSFIMWKIWSYIFRPNSVTNLIAKIGKETMALYILQTIVIEIILSKIVQFIQKDIWHGINFMTATQEYINLLGYVVAPVISFCSIFFLYKIIEITKKNPYLSKIWGFKINTKHF